MRQSTSLRRHLLVLGLLIVSPLLVAGSLIAAFYVIEERGILHNEAIVTVRDAVTAIDHEIRRSILALQTLSTSIDTDEASVERVYRQARQLSGTMPGSVIALRRPDGGTVFNTLFPLGTALERRTNEILGNAEKNATGNRTFAISNVFINRTGNTFVGIVQPIISENQIIYFLELGIPTQVFSNIIRSELRQPEWLIGVTGNDGRMIARNWEPERYIGQKASDLFIQNTQGDEGFFRVTTRDGVRVFNVYARSKLTGWIVGAGIPMNIFDAPLYRSLLILAGITIIALCCSIGLSYAYGQVMLRPAEELRKLAIIPTNERKLPEKTGVREFDTVFALLAERDRHQQTLVNELNHRAKNTLTAIQAITYQTYRQSKSWEEFRENFEHRLLAMAQSFDLLTKHDWRSSDLREIVTEGCKPFCETHRIQLRGPTVLLPPNAVVGIGMVIHELATNATKYGSFSNAIGWVDVNWVIQKSGTTEMLYFHWTEHEGPPVAQTEEKGFGSSLIASTIESDLHGKTETKFERDGLCFSASFPIEQQETSSVSPVKRSEDLSPEAHQSNATNSPSTKFEQHDSGY